MSTNTRLKLPIGVIISEIFSAAFAKLMDLELPQKEAYALEAASRHMQNTVTDYNNTRNRLIVRLGEPVVDDRVTIGDKPNPNHGKKVEGRLRVKAENIAEFNKQIEELQKTEAEIFLDHKIRLPDNAVIKPAIIQVLRPILEGAADGPELIDALTLDQIAKEEAKVVAMPTEAPAPESAEPVMPPGKARVEANMPAGTAAQ